MNYEETMSDFDINQAVTCAVYGCYGWEIHSNGNFFHCGIDGSGYYEQPVLDYCHDWCLSVEIINGHGILMHYNFETGVWEVSALSPYTRIDSENPLRAAMIVFLMTRDEQCLKS